MMLPTLLHLTALSAPLLVAPPADLDLEAVLDRARTAAGRAGWPAPPRLLHFEGRTRTKGFEGPFRLWFGANGEFRFETEGPLASVTAFDGESVRTRDGAGPPREVALSERGTWLLSQWVHSGYWCDAAAPLTVELVDAGPERVVLGLRADGAEGEGRLVLATESWLPTQLRLEGLGGELVLDFAEHRELAGVRVAHSVLVSGSGADGFLTVESARVTREDEPIDLTLASAGAEDTRFDPEHDGELELLRVATGHLLVRADVDGSEPAWFILDSGAGQLCIDPRFADDLLLPAFGSVPAVGIAGSVMARYRGAERFRVGPVELADPVFVELELAFLEPFFGVPVAGICGYELFARTIVELDLAGPRAALHDPARFELQGAEWAPLVLDQRLPTVACRFEGDRHGLFRIDTGDAGSVVFDRVAVDRFGLLEGRELQTVQVGGVGGFTSAKAGPLEWLELGGRRFEAVPATFYVHETGNQSRGETLGTLGSELLTSFRVFFDYPGGRVAFVPRDVDQRED